MCLLSVVLRQEPNRIPAAVANAVLVFNRLQLLLLRQICEAIDVLMYVSAPTGLWNNYVNCGPQEFVE